MENRRNVLVKVLGDLLSKISDHCRAYLTRGEHSSRRGSRAAFIIPLNGPSTENVEITNALVVLHAYYTEIAEAIILRLASLDPAESRVHFRLIVTTDSTAKANYLRKTLAATQPDRLSGSKFMVVANRGRNVAPLLAALDCWQGEEPWILHLHTKASPHAKSLRGWGEYLVETLIGSNEMVRSIAEMLANTRVGLVHPAHYREIIDLRQWGPNRSAGEALLTRMNIGNVSYGELDFPTGFMFWVRRDAIQPLLDAKVETSEFEEERGQLDGTLAHAVERVLNHVVSSSGFTVAAVVSSERRYAFYGKSVRVSLEQIQTQFGRPERGTSARAKRFVRTREQDTT
jgi:O-antigen biosynthesis protein